MAINKLSIALLLSSILVFEINSFAQSKTETIISSLNEVVKPIKTLSADGSFGDINFLKEVLKEKEVIALGEVTHGTREVFDYKDRLVRFLVTNLDYKAIAFESDFIALELIDQYINGGNEKIRNLSGTPLHIDNMKMIEWLRNYNSTQSIENKVHVYGLEARGFNNISGKILAEFNNIRDIDKDILKKFIKTSYKEIQKEDLKLLKKTLEHIRNIKASAIQTHYLNLLDQNITTYKEKNIGNDRDKFMAENAIWLKDRTKKNKLIVWAHNGHVAKYPLYNKAMTGNYLFEKYKTKYYVIATDFNRGEVFVRKYIAKNRPLGDFKPLYYPEVNSDKAYEYYFKQCKYKNFIIDVNSSIKNPILDAFFNKPHDMRLIGATSIPVNKKLSIVANFDMIIYFNTTTSS